MPEQAEINRLHQRAVAAVVFSAMPHGGYAQCRRVQRAADELLYADLWIEPEEPPDDR